MALAVLLSACGKPQAAEAPPSEPEPEYEEPAQPAPEPEAAEDEPEAPAKPEVPEPEFTPGMSVDDAVNAVPKGTERLNLDEGALGKPLSEFTLYEPCKPTERQKWKVRVAIWQGKAVGVDVTATPKNDKFAACVAERVRALEWTEKVPSLNTVEYSF